MADLRSDLRDLASDTNENLREIRNRQDKHFLWLLGGLIGSVVALAGLMATGFGWIGGG